MSNVVSSLAVEIGANINDLQRGLNRADREVRGFADGVAQNMRKTGAALSLGVTLPLAGIATQSVRAAIEWESAFAGVLKTVEGSTEELALLEDQLRELATGATGSPVAGLENAAVTLAGVAEAAGQLGISRENIVEFTETMAMLGMATNLTAEEAAFSLAQFANIVQLPTDEIDNLGSTVVALGNNMATTESQIVEFAQRLAGAGASAGMSEAEILALGGAMASVGLNAEAGGTAMTQVLSEITKAAALGGTELETFAEIAGMSAEEFANKWQSDPMSALTEFISGLGELESSEQLQALDELGLAGVRTSDTLRRLAGNSELLADAVSLANTAWDENTALLNEAQQRAMTTESQFNMLGNNINELAITIGGILLPPINQFITALVPIIQGIASLNPEVLRMGVGFGIAAAAAGPLIGILGAMFSPIGLIAGGLVAVGMAIYNFKDQIRAAVPFVDTLLTAIEGLVAQVAAGENPLQGLFDSLSSVQLPDLTAITTAIQSFAGTIREAFDGYIENIKPGLDAFVQGISNFFAEIGQTDTSGFDNIAMVIGAVVGGIATLMARMGELGGNLAGGVLTGIGDALGPLGAAIRDIVSAFSIAAETGDVGAAFQSLIDGIVNLGAAALAIPKGAAEGVIGLLEDLTGLELPTIDEGLAALGQGISGAWTLIQISIDNVLRGLRIFFIDLRLAIMEPLQSLRRDIMAATEGSAVGTVDIAPNLGVDVANLQLERSSFDINDKLQQEINNGLEAGSIDISQSLGPALAVNAEVLASTMGMQQRTAIQDALNMAISQGDQETFDVLLPLATELGMDVEAMQQQMSMSVVEAAAAPVPVNIPVQVTLDPQFTNFAAFQATVDATARAAAGGGPMPGAAPLPPGFRGGTDYVTSDGLYMLHRGERVLTAQENQGGAGNTQIVVNNYGESMHDVLNRIQRAASDRGY